MQADRAKENDGKATEGLLLGVILALAFLCLSLVRILGDSMSALFDGGVLIAPLEPSIWHMRLAYRLAEFATALVLVHLMLGVFAWALAWLARRAWPESKTSQRGWTCLWMVMIAFWLLAANAAWFPSSSLGNPYAGLVRASIAGLSVFALLSLVLSAAIGITLGRFVWRYRRQVSPPKPAIAGAAAVVGLCWLASIYPAKVWTHASAPSGQPNIIIVGLDSVRADVSQVTSEARVPAISAFLHDATVFTDTTTPLARTFGSWMSILTGRHPHTTGATINLTHRDLIETGETLADALRSAGYRTVYATDEVRFSNIDESYGFDRIVGPRMGSSDFMISFFGDTPLSNLLVNTRFGDLLFPELHGNRAAKLVYDPDTFVRDLERNLDFSTPTFLAVHLTLPHWPYTWARSEPLSGGVGNTSSFPDLYEEALKRVDAQFATLMAMLERKAGLDDAVVVLLSDHGESLGEVSPLADSDGVISRLLGKPRLWGHGTHVFSDQQYKVLLALQTHGDTPLHLQPGARLAVPASLEDVTPTLLDALDIEPADEFDGRSLTAYLGDHAHLEPAKAAMRIRFRETEFNPPGVAVEDTMTAADIARVSASYRIDPVTDRVEMSPDELSRTLDVRQYAALLDGHVLASVPASDPRDQHLVYFDPKGDGPVWLDAPPTADGPPIERQLWRALRDRFDRVAARPIVAIPPDDE
jgi:Sulfatase